MPMIAALRKQHPRETIDLLCPEPLRDLGNLIPGIDRVIGWNGTQWHHWADLAGQGVQPEQLREIEAELAMLCPKPYDRALVQIGRAHV